VEENLKSLFIESFYLLERKVMWIMIEIIGIMEDYFHFIQ